MPPADREKYSAAATLAAASPAPHVIHSSLAATPTSAGPASRGLSSGAGYKHGGRAPSQTTPRRAYVLFCRQERPLLVQANPEWDLPTVNKELGRKWKELTTDQKEVFHDLERKEYESRMVAASVSSGAPGAEPYGTPGYHRNGSYYSGISTPTGSGRPYGGEVAFMARPSKSGAPGGGNPHKGPSKAYVFYSRLNRKGVTSEHPDWDLATVNRELGRMWKTLTLEERHSWEARAAAAAAGDVESASSTPQPRGSPAILTNAPAPASTVTPSPIPAALSMNSENASVSIPATPQSGITTPTAKEDVTMTDRPDYNGEGEGEAEDVEMQDEETEEDEPHSSAGPLKASPLGGAPHTPIPPASTALGSSASHGPAAAPVVLPRHQPVSFSRAPIPAVGPPPTAKPAAVVSNGTGSSAASTPSLHADAMPHAH
ncbi:hypothetical protein IWW52_002447 [Coemansia sp. RSA 2704]|nr:hypothetical protein IWW52_002447 [Coemansia sp. RSA 2704]